MAARAASHCLGDEQPLVEATSRSPRGFEAADHLSQSHQLGSLVVVDADLVGPNSRSRVPASRFDGDHPLPRRVLGVLQNALVTRVLIRFGAF